MRYFYNFSLAIKINVGMVLSGNVFKIILLKKKAIFL